MFELTIGDEAFFEGNSKEQVECVKAIQFLRWPALGVSDLL